MTFEVVLPYPPSTNTYWRHPSRGPLAGRHLISEKGRQYRDAVVRLLAQTGNAYGFSAEARLQVQIEAWMPDKRRRDLDNVLKAALDALTHAGVYPDDSQIDSLTITRAPTVGGMLKVRIAVRGADGQ